MKFKYSVIGDNTAENREWLERLGYSPLRFFLYKRVLYATFSKRANCNGNWNQYYFGSKDNIETLSQKKMALSTA